MYSNELGMNPRLKKYLFRSGVVLISLFLIAVALAALFEDEIGNKIISEINKNIKTKLVVGDVPRNALVDVLE